MESIFVRTNRAKNATVDATTLVQVKKAHTTCNRETGEVEIVWPDNAAIYEGVLGKDVFTTGATKKVHKVFLSSLQEFEILIIVYSY